MDFNFNEKLKIIMKEITDNSIKAETFKGVIEDYKDLGFEIQKTLEYAVRVTKGEEKEKIDRLYRKFLSIYAGEMTEKLLGLGYSLKKDQNYKRVRDALADQAFRIMERTRHAQRSAVFYMIGRIFTVNKKEFPPLLAQAFNPNYTDELFKTYIYSFLSGILGETEPTQGGTE